MSEKQRELLGRREFVKRAGAAGLVLGSEGVLAACGVKSSSSGGSSNTIKIGYVSLLTGEAASFGEPDSYVLGVVRKAIANGITGSDGKHYTTEFIQRDSQGPTLATAAYWHPVWPYKSSLTGLTGPQMQSGYEATGKQWTQQLGADFALWDVGVAALKHAPNPKDKPGLANSIATLKVSTPMGNLDWTKGPVKNVVDTVIPGSQWFKSKPGSKFPLELLMTEPSQDPSIPIQAKLVPYGSV